ncbi:MAG: c-type cytochrome [Myxococcaceae bacterium]|nr:c-type cytochrome [Myxococcaceae bacterium]
MKTEPNSPVHHVYDGIEEQDNYLPNWWLTILFGSIVFAAGYWFVYHSAKLLPLPGQVYEAEAAAWAEAQRNAPVATDSVLLALVDDTEVRAEGKQVFSTVCATCHGQKGEGLVGPNLTDGYWLHGNKPTELYRGVSSGYVDKGMPSWGPALGEKKVRAVVAYLMTIRGQNVAGKAPQGEQLP